MLKKFFLYGIFLFLFTFCFSVLAAPLTEYKLTDSADNESSIDSDAYDGEGHVVYVKGSNVYYKKGIGDEELVGVGNNPAIAVDTNGTPHVVYLNGGNAYYNYYDGDWDNQTTLNVQESGAPSFSASAIDIDTDSNNKAHILIRAYYYNDSDYYSNKIDILYLNNVSGSFSFIRGWDGIWDYWSPDGRGLYFSSHPINIKIDSSNNYHIVFWRQEYVKAMGWNESYYTIRHYTNITGGDSSIDGNFALYKNGLSTNGTTAHLMYGSPLRYGQISGGSWDETTTPISGSSDTITGTPNLDYYGGNIGMLYRDSSGNIIYIEDSGSDFTGSNTIFSGASESSLAMDSDNFYYTIKSDGNDNELYLRTAASMDTTPPSMTITNPLSGDIVRGDEVITFTGTELVDPECSIDASNWTGCTSDDTTLSDLPGFNALSDGPFTLYMTETDDYNNVGTGAEGGIIKDTTTPNVFSDGGMTAYPFAAVFSGVTVMDINLDLSGSMLFFGTGTTQEALRNQINMDMDWTGVGSGAYNLYYPLMFSGLETETTYNYFYEIYDLAGNSFESEIGNVTTQADPVAEMFGEIYDGLVAFGIESNLDEVNASNISSFNGLFFEDSEYGKVTFSGGLDLSDEDTQDLLMELETVLDMDEGYLEFQLSGSALQAFGAHVDIYFTEVLFPEGTVDIDNISVFDDNGIALEPSDVISNLACVEVGGPGDIVEVCSFDVSHFTTFDFNPQITSATIYSNNNDTEVAKVGNEIQLEFYTNEPIKTPIITIGKGSSLSGNVELYSGAEGAAWMSVYEIGTGDIEGQVTYSIQYMDLEGNAGETLTGTTDSSFVIFDKTAPTASISYSTTNPTNGNVTATLIGASEPITITNNQPSSTLDTGGYTIIGDNTYTFTTNGSFTFEFEDVAGNTGTATATVTNIDKTPPTATVTYSETAPTNQNVVATLTGASEPITITNNGPTSLDNVILIDVRRDQYTFTANGSFTFEFEDAAGNTGTATATVSNIDKIPPTASIEYSNTNLTNQDVTATLTGASESITITNNNGSENYVFTSNGSFTFEFEDEAGNTGSKTATVTNIDKTKPDAPTINSVTELISEGNVYVTGHGELLEKINIYVNGEFIKSEYISYPVGVVTTIDFAFYVDNKEFDEGENIIKFSQTDVAGNESVFTINYTVEKDTTGPEITNQYITAITQSGANLYFFFEDDHIGDTQNINSLQPALSLYGEVEVYEAITQIPGEAEINLLRSGLTFPLNMNFDINKGSSVFDGLNANTRYKYNLNVRDDLGNRTTKNGLFATAPEPVEVGTGGTTYEGIIALTGSLGDGEDYYLSGDLRLNSDPNNFQHGLTGSLLLSGIDGFTIDGSEWNGVLMPPTEVLSGYDEFGNLGELGLDDLFGNGAEAGGQVIGTYQVGGPKGTGLIPIGGNFYVEIYVELGSEGDILYIFRSEDGETWELNSPDQYCTLDENLICGYFTDHLSYFTSVEIPDMTPDEFDFTDITNASLSKNYTSDTVTIEGIDTEVDVTIDDGSVSINGGEFVTEGTINNGGTIKIKLMSSDSYEEKTTATVTVGNGEADFSITTKKRSSGGGGGSAYVSDKDWCPNGDYSGNYYDRKCGTAPVEGLTGTVDSNMEYEYNNSKYAILMEALWEYVDRNKDMYILVGILDDKGTEYYTNISNAMKDFEYALQSYDAGIISSKTVKKEISNLLAAVKKYKEAKNRLLKKKYIRIGSKRYGVYIPIEMNESTANEIDEIIKGLKTLEGDVNGNNITKLIVAYVAMKDKYSSTAEEIFDEALAQIK